MNLENLGVQEMSAQEAMKIDGGGEWSWGEATICFLLAGPLGVGFYYLGTQQ